MFSRIGWMYRIAYGLQVDYIFYNVGITLEDLSYWSRMELRLKAALRVLDYIYYPKELSYDLRAWVGGSYT